MKFYVYIWKDLSTNEVFYVGKGCKKRYKDLSHRNKMFLDFIATHDVVSEIVKYFDSEEDAFAFERELTKYYKNLGQAQCSLMDGGYGGYSKVWSTEMREYWSKYNPMKSLEQRERMVKNNPMQNKDVAKAVGIKHRRAVVLNGVTYDATITAAKELGVSTNTVLSWCKRGYDTNGNPCRYADSPQKDFQIQKTNSKAVYLDGVLFNSIREVANYLGMKDSTPICRALKNNKLYKGHVLKYANQQPS